MFNNNNVNILDYKFIIILHLNYIRKKTRNVFKCLTILEKTHFSYVVFEYYLHFDLIVCIDLKFILICILILVRFLNSYMHTSFIDL